MKKLRRLTVLFATATALLYFFDPAQGRKRREAARDRLKEMGERAKHRFHERRHELSGQIDQIAEDAELPDSGAGTAMDDAISAAPGEPGSR